MRARNLKPGFFKNEDLADCDPHTRLLFIGLWCLGDREGRLEDRPKRIKAEVFLYDKVDIEKLLKELTVKKFIIRENKRTIVTTNLTLQDIEEILGARIASRLPDICGVYKGRAIAIELKAPRGIVSPHQQAFIDRINEAGGLAFVVKDLDTVIEKMGLQDRFLIR